MRDQKTRDMMTKIYRLVEKYEDPPVVESFDDAVQYFTKVGDDCSGVYNEYKDNAFAREFAIAVYEAINNRFTTLNKSLSK